MLDLWWWQAGEQQSDWCEARRHWLGDAVPARPEALISRLWRRELLARYSGIEAAAQQFQIGKKGKPELVGSRLHFSIAHSGGWHVCLLADSPCGVDVEPWDRSLERLMRPAVLERFAEEGQLTDTVQFLRCWTLKEAWAKRGGQSVWDVLATPLEGTSGEWRIPEGQSGYCDPGACIAWALQSDVDNGIDSAPLVREYIPKL